MLKVFKKYQNVLFIIGVALVAYLLGAMGGNLFDAAGGNLSGAAGMIADQSDCDTSSLSNDRPTGIVLADPLNLRVGPGLDYHVTGILDFCTSLSLLGRSGDGAWLEVELPGSVIGWVFSYYVQTNVNINELEVTTGFGGADTSGGSPSGQRNVSVIIQVNQAVAFVTGMPANADVSAVLSPTEGSGKSLSVASGRTDAQGDTILTFTMPDVWADGSELESGTMTLTIKAGGESLTAWLTYYTQ
ncbi:MAG: SH3 domain-containing protein [Anaerolineae bacterium]|nr:SH3 domain-containing protein [Anaerolineae bacterium]